MLPSISIPAWHVYLVLHVSLVQYCAYAYRMMKVQKLVPGGSCTYSISSLKLCQGGPHLQSNLTTKVKYSTTSNQILRDANWCCSAVCSERELRGLHPVSCVCALLTWLICRPSIGPVQCHDCFGKERAPNLHEREFYRHTGACL